MILNQYFHLSVNKSYLNVLYREMRRICGKNFRIPCSETLFISLNTHSVWETICDAVASWGGRFYCQNHTEWPILGKSRIPLPELERFMEDLQTLVLSLPRMPSTPQKMELLMEDLGTLVMSLPRMPPSRIGTSHGRLCEVNWCVSPTDIVCGAEE